MARAGVALAIGVAVAARVGAVGLTRASAAYGRSGHRGAGGDNGADHRQCDSDAGPGESDAADGGTARDAFGRRVVVLQQLRVSEVVERQINRQWVELAVLGDLLPGATAVAGLPDESGGGVQRVRAAVRAVEDQKLITDGLDDDILAAGKGLPRHLHERT